MKKLKSYVFVGNTGHFHSEIDFAGSEALDGVKVDNDRLGRLRGLGRHESRHFKPQVNRLVFPVGHGVIVLNVQCSPSLLRNKHIMQVSRLKGPFKGRTRSRHQCA